jgi:tryptophan synthase alpha chain
MPAVNSGRREKYVMNRIRASFERMRAEGRTGLVAYVTVGFPDVSATLKLVRALVAGGADVVELGVPFSDPLADGATIQRSTQRALEQGVTVGTCLDVVAQLRASGVEAPFVFMTYLNPLLAYGLDRFFAAAGAAGLDGLILIDVPSEEAGEIQQRARAAGVDLIQLIAPTTPEKRAAELLRDASGFVYCVSVAGTTGVRAELPPELPELIARLRRHTTLPIAVGFGISRPEHVASIGKVCEAAVIGSAIVDLIERTPADERESRVREYVEEVTGRRRISG